MDTRDVDTRDVDTGKADTGKADTRKAETGKVERRREPRYESRQPARIRSLTSPDDVADGMLLNISGRGARLSVERPFPINTPVRIDFEDTLLLGDVCYCRAESPGFSLGIALSHSVLEMTSLGRLMDRLVRPSAEQTHDHSNRPNEVKS